MVEKKAKEINSLLETAEASLRVGLISQQDFDKIKQEVAQQAQAEENSQNDNKEIDDKGNSTNDSAEDKQNKED